MGKSSTIKSIAQHMRRQKESGKSTALLVGAGISRSAGVPLALEMIGELRGDANYSYRFDGADIPSDLSEYNTIMDSLTFDMRQGFIRKYTESARINLAHLYIGTLIKEGYVDCVMTTNFDPLLVKTLSLFNHHAYVYDLANVTAYVPTAIMYPNIFYLHGQGHAFLMLNTEDELQQIRKYFHSLMMDMVKQHFFLSIGYSGHCDFIFNELCAVHEYPHDFQWVGFKEEEPPKHLQESLYKKSSVKYIDSNGADSFFRDLVNELGLPLPSFFEQPFEHLKSLMDNIGDLSFDDGTQMQPSEIKKQPLAKIEAAIELVENGKGKELERKLAAIETGELSEEIERLFLQNKYEEIIALESTILALNNEALIDKLAWAYEQKGFATVLADDRESGKAAFERAILLKGNYYEAWLGWGHALAKLAISKGYNEEIFRECFVKCAEAVKIAPERHAAWHNWGTALRQLGATKGNDEALIRESLEKIAKAAQLDPAYGNTWDQWGHALLIMYNITKQPQYLIDAAEKLEIGNRYLPHSCDYNLACTHALRGNITEALQLLDTSLQYRYSDVSRGSIEHDTDLAALHGLPEFVALLDRYF